MARSIGWFVAPLALLASAGVARAGTFTGSDGVPRKLALNQEVTGPGKITGLDPQDTIELRKDAVVRYLGDDTEKEGNTELRAENYFLKRGAADSSLGYFTRLATPSFYAFPLKRGERVTFYAETFNAELGYARSRKGLLRLLETWKSAEVDLNEGQGVTLSRHVTGRLDFATDPDNSFERGLARLVYFPPGGTSLVIDLRIPKATTGSIGPGAPGWTRVENKISSWKSGKIRIVTILAGVTTGEGEIGPGVVANIDNASGRIEIGFVKVEFATLKAAISLTSEFAAAATSLFFKP